MPRAERLRECPVSQAIIPGNCYTHPPAGWENVQSRGTKSRRRSRAQALRRKKHWGNSISTAGTELQRRSTDLSFCLLLCSVDAFAMPALRLRAFARASSHGAAAEASGRATNHSIGPSVSSVVAGCCDPLCRSTLAPLWRLSRCNSPAGSLILAFLPAGVVLRRVPSLGYD